MNNVELSHEEVNSLYQLAFRITASPSVNPEIFIHEVKCLSNFVPMRIKKLLKTFSDGSGHILIRKIPTVDKPSTPSDNTHHLGEKTTMAKIQALFNQNLGEMVAYEAEGYGRLFQDMVPNFQLSQTQTSLSSNVELEIHTEQAFSGLKPDYLSLACLRGDPNAKTYVFHINTLLENLTEEKIEMLYKPLWKIGVDMSFKMNKYIHFLEGNVRGPLPILDKETGLFVFDQDLMSGITEEAENLKKEIIEIYRIKKSELVLEEGDVVILDNRCVVHGRSPFNPKYDGSDRFIVRSFVMTDYKKSEYARQNSLRMIETKYS
jgi:L-asparagine oxygenase